MTISGIERETEHEVLAALRSFAELPAWLAQAMDPVRVRAELERHVPELATNAMRLVSCEPSRLRAKGDQWLARYELIVADADHRARDAGRRVALVGVLEPPGRGSQEPSAPAPVAVPFGHPTGSVGCRTCGCTCARRSPTTTFPPCRCSPIRPGRGSCSRTASAGRRTRASG
jgi:hypothetical protein